MHICLKLPPKLLRNRLFPIHRAMCFLDSEKQWRLTTRSLKTWTSTTAVNINFELVAPELNNCSKTFSRFCSRRDSRNSPNDDIPQVAVDTSPDFCLMTPLLLGARKSARYIVQFLLIRKANKAIAIAVRLLSASSRTLPTTALVDRHRVPSGRPGVRLTAPV